MHVSLVKTPNDGGLCTFLIFRMMMDTNEGKDYKRVGGVNEVCFVERLVYFKNKWFLYYGTADSKIAVAVRE